MQAAAQSAELAGGSLLLNRMEPKRIDNEGIFRKYTRLKQDRCCLIIDVRPQKEFKRRHLLLSYCIRLTSDGKALADYSKNLYDSKWTQVRLCLRGPLIALQKLAIQQQVGGALW